MRALALSGLRNRPLTRRRSARRSLELRIARRRSLRSVRAESRDVGGRYRVVLVAIGGRYVVINLNAVKRAGEFVSEAVLDRDCLVVEWIMT